MNGSISTENLFTELTDSIDALQSEAMTAGHPLGTSRAMNEARKDVDAAIERLRERVRHLEAEVYD